MGKGKGRSMMAEGGGCGVGMSTDSYLPVLSSLVLSLCRSLAASRRMVPMQRFPADLRVANYSACNKCREGSHFFQTVKNKVVRGHNIFLRDSK